MEKGKSKKRRIAQVKEFAKEQGYDGAKFLCDWGAYKVYEMYYEADKEGAAIGWPAVALDDGEEIKTADHEQIKDIINSFPEEEDEEEEE